MALLGITLVAAVIYNQQNATVASVQEIESTLSTNITGNLRGNEQGKLTKQELVTSVIAKTVEVQKTHDTNLKIDFAFLDKNDKKTNQENAIESVQIQTSILNKNGEVRSLSVKRISLKQQ